MFRNCKVRSPRRGAQRQTGSEDRSTRDHMTYTKGPTAMTQVLQKRRELGAQKTHINPGELRLQIPTTTYHHIPVILTSLHEL